MAINVTWDGTTYSIPQSGEYNWPALTNFLVALGNKAAVADEAKQAIRKATSSPVAVSATSDYAVVTDLTVAGAVTVNLPAGAPGQIFVIVDGKGDAATNNVTINRAGSDTIAGQTTLVLNKDRQVAMLQYNSGDTDWKLINFMIPPGQVMDSDISGVISTAGKVSGNAITSGTIGGSTALNTSGSVTLTGSGALSVAGTAALNGGVTIGDQSTDALTINSNAASIPNGLNFDANTLVIDSTLNRVGIGTASPSQALDVVGTVNATTVAAATVNAGDLNASGNTALGDASSDVLTINGTAVTIPNGLNIDSNTLVVDAANNRVGINNASPTVPLDVTGAVALSSTLTVAGNVTQTGTGSLKVAAGTTAERPGTPANGMIRYNSDNGAFEGYASNAWAGIGGGGTVDKITQASHGFVSGDVGKAVYLNGAVYALALASAANTAEVVGVISRIIDTNTFEITLSGEITGLTGLTAGEVYFLSASSPGVLTITEPNTVGEVSIPVGIASSTTTLYVAPKRGVVVGGANARTQVSLLNNSINQQVQDVNAYEAGELAGWVYIDASTDLRFYVQAQFVKGGDNIYDMSYQVSGDTPPAGFLMLINSGIIRITMPNIAGYSAGYINFALNAPAVGTNFPLTVDGANVTAASASTPGVVSLSNQSLGAGDKYFSGNVGVGTTSPQTQFELFSSSDPICGFYRNTSTTNVGLGRVRWDGLNVSSTRVNYGYLQMGIQTNTAGSHGGYFAFVTTFNGSPVERMRLTSEGYLAVGSPTILSPIAAASVNDSVLSLQHKNSTVNGGRIEYFDQNGTRRVYMGGTSSSSSNFQITVHESGGVVLAPGATSWSAAVSDERKKKDFETSQGLAEVLQIEPIKYRFDTETDSAPKRLGFKAQNLLPLIPEMVLPTGEKAEDGSDYLTITPDYLLPVLVKAIQELKAELDAVKSELAALK